MLTQRQMDLLKAVRLGDRTALDDENKLNSTIFECNQAMLAYLDEIHERLCANQS